MQSDRKQSSKNNQGMIDLIFLMKIRNIKEFQKNMKASGWKSNLISNSLEIYVLYNESLHF